MTNMQPQYGFSQVAAGVYGRGATLEALTPGARVRGVVVGSAVTVISAQWHGSNPITLTYRDDAGSVAVGERDRVGPVPLGADHRDGGADDHTADASARGERLQGRPAAVHAGCHLGEAVLRLHIGHFEITLVRRVCERYVLTQLPRCYVDLATAGKPRGTMSAAAAGAKGAAQVTVG